MRELTDLEKRLTAAERERSSANVRPKDAATLMIVDRSGPTPKVLLGKRHHAHKFMPGKFVFPGGRLESNDRLMPSATPLNPYAEKYLMQKVKRPSAARAKGLALAAIRETFEETGLILGTPMNNAAPVPEGPWADFAKAGFYPDLSSLHFIARAITPSRRPRRFDTRFFAVDASTIAHKIDNVVHPDAELVELVWMPISEARSLDMPTITSVVLQELEARVAAGFGHDLPVPFYRMPRTVFYRDLIS
ncbi:NUDIX hydrolase [Pseudorhodoplanes sp.]|uniref:NUDIX hydrolase n=1 Tax=Pseudorhodoplanes sp. TaxID=1934341 RepID=UPI002C0588A9|nr:NUDIX hydrolase [Pseudorhodoplanes sp.]HWV53329.1 NUDIX hydrolase [Pseudorhodoplanes sp.]